MAIPDTLSTVWENRANMFVNIWTLRCKVKRADVVGINFTNEHFHVRSKSYKIFYQKCSIVWNIICSFKLCNSPQLKLSCHIFEAAFHWTRSTLIQFVTVLLNLQKSETSKSITKNQRIKETLVAFNVSRIVPSGLNPWNSHNQWHCWCKSKQSAWKISRETSMTAK